MKLNTGHNWGTKVTREEKKKKKNTCPAVCSRVRFIDLQYVGTNLRPSRVSRPCVSLAKIGAETHWTRFISLCVLTLAGGQRILQFPLTPRCASARFLPQARLPVAAVRRREAMAAPSKRKRRSARTTGARKRPRSHDGQVSAYDPQPPKNWENKQG